MRIFSSRRTEAAVSMIGAIILVVAGLLIGAANERAFQAGRAQSLTAQAEVLASTVEPALVFLDAQAAQELVSALKSDRRIEAAAVYNDAGQRVAQLAQGPATLPARSTDARPSRRGGATAVTAPVRHEGRGIGLVFLRTAPERPMAFVQRHGGIALLLLTAVLLLTVSQRAQVAQARSARESEARALELDDLNKRLQHQIERRERAEEALRHAQKMESLGQLTGGIAHDFNNLLQTIKGSLDLIGRNPHDGTRVSRWAGMASEAADRGARVTAQLLAFSREQKLEMRIVNVRDVIGRLQAILPNALSQGVSVDFEVGDGETLVLADATQLELAVLNLCINARDAMPNGGKIRVEARTARVEDDSELAAGDYLLLSVSDTGVGMPRDVQTRAFEPFFTTKGIGKGTGLGLAQVYGIARQAGGTARIESGAGGGTEVTIYMPLASGASSVEARGSAPGTAAKTREARILVVDDDEGVLAYMCEALSSLGYDCLQASGGAEGLEVLAKEKIDMMIVDYAMPGMTGAEVAKAALSSRPDLPILFASGYAESSALEAALGHPAMMLRKPFDTETLAQRVAEALAA